MFSRKAEGQPAVIVPTPDQDRPSWVKIGVIAAVGFGLGILWPRVAGLRLAPSAPESVAPESQSSTTAVTASAASLAPTAPAPNASQATSAAPAPTAATPASPMVTVGHGFAYACKTLEGESLRGSSCGGLPALDNLAQPRLKKLAQCAGAQASVGKLHLVLHADFERGTLAVNSGKGSTIAAPEAALLCARREFEGAQLTGVDHTHKRYSVAYTVTFAAPAPAGASDAPGHSDAPGQQAPAATDGAAAANAAADAPAKDLGAGADAGAEVVWEVGIVRDAPKTGHIVARLPRGTKIKLGPPKDGWYPVKFGADFGSDGFLYRGAIGK